MAGTDITTAQANLDAANDAYLVALKSKSYTIGSRSKTNQEIRELRDDITHWSGVVQRLTRGGIPVRGITA
jgi:hypothetical protein